MPDTIALQDSLTELSYAQLAQALASSVAKRRLYWAAFTAAAAMIAEGPADELEEVSAEMRGHLAAVEAQDTMTTAICIEIGRRIRIEIGRPNG